MDELLRLENLSVGYPVKEGLLSAVSCLNLTVHKGEIYALVGESGCGKSTAAFASMGLLEDTAVVSGSIRYIGRQLLGAPRETLESVRGCEIGMIFQNPMESLNPVYRSGAQVAEAVRLDRLDRRAAWNRVLELYRDVRIPDASRTSMLFPHELSGGMRQRVMIAMMLSRKPSLLICDEPTTALDVTIESQILDIIRHLREASRTAFLIITHNFGIVAELADRIGVMYAGELVEEADVFTLFDRPAHPYTRALLGSLPKGSKRDGRLQTIEGIVPRIMDGYAGCRFANRCPDAAEVCTRVPPPTYSPQPGHTVVCHRMEAKS